MKKTLVALGVMAASSAQAGLEVYNHDGIKVNLQGKLEVVHERAISDNSPFKRRVDDADFGFDVNYTINDDLQLSGHWEFEGSSDNTGSIGDVYLTLHSQSLGSLRIGRTCGALDDVGISSDYQLGENSFLHADESLFCGDEMVRYDMDTGMFYGTLSYAQDKNGNFEKIGEHGSYADARVGFRAGSLDFSVAYGDIDADNFAAKESLLALEARFSGIENTNLAIAYYTVDGDISQPGTDIKRDNIYLAADYMMNKWLFAAGYNIADIDHSDIEDVDSWYVNAGYSLAPKTTAYFEVAGNSEDQSQTGVVLGIKATF
ncbi:porin-like protein H [Candidatus Photodesmus blepharus]|uniref:Porin-like protein H n=1 Tax=Candidatus Photodesmus blepharonis TaxID=1179155 RepID=A0A084CN58_9GAMM|nr:porin [Candidatus Photodesmus blepharus]KEY91237.1 porin-like protein H [Candidatus Photodesmus blepharus]